MAPILRPGSNNPILSGLAAFSSRTWLRSVNKNTILNDLEAGATCALISIPQGIAFATLAGMPPVYGIYAAIVPTILAAVFGSSNHLVSGPTTAVSILMISSLSEFAMPGSSEYIGLALSLAFLVGLLILFVGIVGLGVIANFVAHAVLVGFTAGAATLIVLSQMPSLIGASCDAPIRAFSQINCNSWSHYALLVSLVTIASDFAAKKLWPRLPSTIVAIITGTVFAQVLIFSFGDGVVNLQFLSKFTTELPTIMMPVASQEIASQLAPAVLAMSILVMVESASISRAIASKSGQYVNINQEFIGQGLANVVGSFCSAYVSAGSFNRTALNFQSGAKTPLAAIISALLLLIFLPFVGSLASLLPLPVVSATLVVVALRLADLQSILRILRSNSVGTILLLTTFLSTLVFTLDFAILFGMLMSFVVYLNRTSRPGVRLMVPDTVSLSRSFTQVRSNHQTCPQCAIFRVDGSLYFGSVAHVQDELRNYSRSNGEVRYVGILAEGINFVDLSGAEFLAREATRLRELGGGLYLCGFKKENFPAFVERGGYLRAIGEDRIFNGKSELLAAITSSLDKKICATCQKRIFIECRNFPGAERFGDAAGPKADEDEQSGH